MAKLKRALNLFQLTMYGVGIILGAGIYAIIGKGAGIAGNALWMAFAIGAVIAALTGLSYAELGSMFPKDAAEYIYTEKGFKRKYPAFLVGWMMIFIGIVTSAVVALGFGGYFEALTGVPMMFAAIALILIATFVNYWGITESAKTNTLFTIVEVLGLLIIIFLGLPHIGSVDYFEMANGFEGVFSAAILLFFAYLGFDEIVNLAEETKNPKRNIPLAIIFSIIISTVLYILVSIVSVSVVPWQQLSQTVAPLALVADTAMPGMSFMLSVIALFATANTVLVLVIVQSRVLWGMAIEKSLPRWLGKIDPVRKTPWVAILITMLISLIFVIWGDIRKVAEISDVGMFLVFIAVNASLILLRYNSPKLKRPFRVPFNIGWFPVLPFLGILITLGLMLYINQLSAIVVTVLLVIGTVLYYIIHKFHWIKI